MSRTGDSVGDGSRAVRGQACNHITGNIGDRPRTRPGSLWIWRRLGPVFPDLAGPAKAPGAIPRGHVGAGNRGLGQHHVGFGGPARGHCGHFGADPVDHYTCHSLERRQASDGDGLQRVHHPEGGSALPFSSAPSYRKDVFTAYRARDPGQGQGVERRPGHMGHVWRQYRAGLPDSRRQRPCGHPAAGCERHYQPARGYARGAGRHEGHRHPVACLLHHDLRSIPSSRPICPT